ncbi:MAG TPA: hypothetical protein VF032_20245 [Thermoleophilaceae bacterium]
MTPEELLERFKPHPKYDSQEAFFADSAEELTANPGDELRRGDGQVIATAGKDLSLSTLGVEYPDGSAAASSDVLGIHGKDYRTQYTKLREARADLRNVIYGHAVPGANGKLWLQYWFWYFYNDYQLAAGFGLHEGDWEMVQIRLAEDERPELALYAQHAYAESKPWDEVETTPDGHPVTYPGRGSHASYFRPGLYETEGWYDIVDGKREAPELQLVVISDDGPGWVSWPGAWGDTKPRIQGLEEPSPTGPSQHPQWENPEVLFDSSIDRTVKAPPEPPELDATREHGDLWVKFDVSDVEPLKLIATVNSHDEPGVPPKTFTFDIAGKGQSGQFDTQLTLDDHKRYEVDLSITMRAGDTELPTLSRCIPLAPGVASKIPDWVKHPIWAIEQFVDGKG